MVILEQALAFLSACKETKNPEIPHEWTFSDQDSANIFADQLRKKGYLVKQKAYKVVSIDLYYVGVPFDINFLNEERIDHG